MHPDVHSVISFIAHREDGSPVKLAGDRWWDGGKHWAQMLCACKHTHV